MALLRDQLEAVAGGAGVEGIITSRPGWKFLGAFVARRENLRLRRRQSGRQRNADQQDRRKERAAAQTARRRTLEYGASADQHRNPMHRIAAVALRIPDSGEMRLHRSLGVGAARPDFEIAVGRQLHRRGPALPVVFVLRASRLWRASRSRRSRSTHRPACTVRSPAQAAPRSFTSLVPAASLVPFAGLVMIERTGIDSRSRKFFSIRLVARNHRLDRDAIGRTAHARAVMHLVTQPDTGEPLGRHRAGPAGDQAAAPARRGCSAAAGR